MKGIVFNLLEEVVRRAYGEDTWDTLLEAAGLDGVYTSLGNYPHEELLQLVTAVQETRREGPLHDRGTLSLGFRAQHAVQAAMTSHHEIIAARLLLF
jgi:hypothetical protein